MKNPSLWCKIKRFSFDDPDADFSFSDRLAQENNWSKRFAVKVIDEYRRFCYLAVVCDHEVTPSVEVDQAWHLHLLYTRQYWGDWCALLGSPLHHGPTKGGNKENSRYWDNYENTLASYKSEFDRTPPDTIWPDANTRFGTTALISTVNRSDNLVIPKQTVLSTAQALAGIAAIIGVGYATFNSALAQTGDGAAGGLTTLGWIGVGILVAIVIGGIWFLLFGHRSNKSKNKGCSSGSNVGGGGCGNASSKKSGGDGGSGCGSGCGGGGCGGGS